MPGVRLHATLEPDPDRNILEAALNQSESPQSLLDHPKVRVTAGIAHVRVLSRDYDDLLDPQAAEEVSLHRAVR